jgi:hypothetical protein
MPKPLNILFGKFTFGQLWQHLPHPKIFETAKDAFLWQILQGPYSQQFIFFL